jgi:hypothetical protein
MKTSSLFSRREENVVVDSKTLWRMVVASSDLIEVVSWGNVVESGKTSSELGMAAYGSLSSIQKSLPTKT